MPSFTVLSINMHKGFASLNGRFILGDLRDAVRRVHADVVFLQEVLGEHRGHAERVAGWPEVPQYEFLADTLWNEFAYGRNAVYPHGHHGNALLSKFPIVRYDNRDVSIGTQEQRGLLHCVLRIPDESRELHAVCVHLGLRESHRRRQIDTLCALIDDELPPDAPVVVAGDFNDWRRRGHDRLTRCVGVREAFDARCGRLARTFPARWPLLPLDRIYVRNASVRSADVLSSRPWSHLSDHAALTAEIAA